MADLLTRQLVEAAERCEDEGEARLATLLREAHDALATAGQGAETPTDAVLAERLECAAVLREWMRRVTELEQQLAEMREQCAQIVERNVLGPGPLRDELVAVIRALPDPPSRGDADK